MGSIRHRITSQNSPQAWVVCTVASLYTFYMFIQTARVNAIASSLMTDFRIGAVGLGILSSMYFWGNIAFLFPAGLLLDRVPAKKLLLVAIGIDIFSTFIFSCTNNLIIAAMCFALTGATGAFTLLLPLRLASRWFTANKMAFVNGLIITMGFTGYMVSQAPLAALAHAIGWRGAMQCNTILAVGIFILSILFIKDFHDNINKKRHVEQIISFENIWHSIKTAICNRQNWLFGLYTNLINLPILVFGATFGVRYIVQVSGVTEERASIATLLLFLGAALGSPIFGWLSDRIKLRKPIMYFGGTASLILILAIMYVVPDYYTICILFFATGFFTSSQSITYPVITESNKVENIGAGLSMGSILIMSGGAIFIPLFGWLMDLHWDGKMVNGVPWHSINDYRLALWLLPITTIIGTVGIIFGRETNCKRID